MRRRSTPGLGQWLVVSFIVIFILFLLSRLLQYANTRQYYPAGLTIAGVNVGGYAPEQAEELISNRYNAPIILFHGENRIPINPIDVEFQLDLETMTNQAEFQKAQQDYWAGFWGYLLDRPVEISDIELYATHNQDALVDVLEFIASRYDTPAQPPQPVPGSFSFQYGDTGIATDIEGSLDDVTAALYRATDREVHLTLTPTQPERPEINLLARLIVNSTQEFEQINDGVASIFILDLENGDEIFIDADVAMSGMGMMKAPIILTAYRSIIGTPTSAMARMLEEAMLALDDEGANQLLSFIAGEDDPDRGAAMVTETMQALGLVNTYMAVPYGEEPRSAPSTPANSVEGLRTNPSPAMQTTAEDLGILLSLIYYCARDDGGALAAIFPEEITAAECQAMIDMMSLNEIGSLIEQGVPSETQVAHRHGWIDDTHGDAGIIFSDGGAYVLVEIFFKPSWLEWEISSPLMANISRATYNFFNFDNPYLGEASSN